MEKKEYIGQLLENLRKEKVLCLKTIEKRKKLIVVEDNNCAIILRTQGKIQILEWLIDMLEEDYDLM